MSNSTSCDRWTLGKDVENNPPLLEDMGLCPIQETSLDNVKNLSSGTNKVLQPISQNLSNIEGNFIKCDKNFDNFFVFKRRRLDDIAGEDKFNKLLDEVVLMIFKWLPKNMLVRCAQVCRRWKRLAFDQCLWRRVDLGNKTLNAAVIGRVILRGCHTLRLSRAEIQHNIFIPAFHALARPGIKCFLQNLDLSMAAIDVETLEEILSICVFLKRLSLEHVTLNERCCRYISQNGDLHTLNLAMCYGLPSEGLVGIFQNCQKLQFLNLAWVNFGSKDLSLLCKHFPPSLLRLNISGCRNTLTDNHVRAMVSRFPSLLDLDVSDAGLITEVSMKLIIGKLRFLEYLAFSRCFSIPIGCYLDLRLMPHLMYLDMYGLISEKALSTLRDSLPKIKINEYLFSSVARPTVAPRRTSIWGFRVRD